MTPEQLQPLLQRYPPYEKLFVIEQFTRPAYRKKVNCSMPGMLKWQREHTLCHDSGELTVATMEQLCAAPLLTARQERFLFRQVNYFKWQANGIREQLVRGQDDKVRAWLHCHRKVAQARGILIESNLRLIVKVSRGRKGSFDSEFFARFSDGIMALYRAVDGFDFRRGYHFSTYATVALQNDLRRRAMAEKRPLVQSGRMSKLDIWELADLIRDKRLDRSCRQDKIGQVVHNLLDYLRRVQGEQCADIIERRYLACPTQTIASISQALGISESLVYRLRHNGLACMARRIRRLYPNLAEQVLTK